MPAARAAWAAGMTALLAACGTRPAPAPTPAPIPAPAAATPPRTAGPERPAAKARAPRAAVSLTFTGDINLGTATLPNGVPPDDGRGLLDAARPYLRGDLVIGNFEGVLADSGESAKCAPPPTPRQIATRARRAGPRRAKKHPWQHRRSISAGERAALDTAAVSPAPCFAFRTPTSLAPRVAEAGFTHLNLANNHADDYGVPARLATEQLLGALGVATYGPLGSVAIDTVRRGDSATVVGLVGFATYPFAYDLLNVDRSRAVVDSLRPLVDVLVVTFHGGTEGADAAHLVAGPEFLGREPRGDLRNWAHAVVDAGADVVVGHGPHVLRGLEFYRGRPIAYSMGNFLNYRGFALAGALGVTAVLQVELAGDGRFRRGRLVSMLQMPQRGPRPDSTAAALELVRQLSDADFGPTAARITDAGEITPP